MRYKRIFEKTGVRVTFLTDVPPCAYWISVRVCLVGIGVSSTLFLKRSRFRFWGFLGVSGWGGLVVFGSS